DVRVAERQDNGTKTVLRDTDVAVGDDQVVERRVGRHRNERAHFRIRKDRIAGENGARCHVRIFLLEPVHNIPGRVAAVARAESQLEPLPSLPEETLEAILEAPVLAAERYEHVYRQRA